MRDDMRDPCYFYNFCLHNFCKTIFMKAILPGTATIRYQDVVISREMFRKTINSFKTDVPTI